jgi:hypothetical protein
MQCSNNLKQMGLAVHNFHDSRDGVPPLLIYFHHRMTVFGLLYPFAEQSAMYDRLTAGDTSGNKEFNPTWWASLTASEKKSFSSVKYMKCPSRRKSGAVYNDSNFNPGPLADYAVPVTATTGGLEGNMWIKFIGSTASYTGTALPSVPIIGKKDSDLRNAIRTAIPTIESGNVINWEPRDAMARWTDGTSNTIIIGERHVPSSRMGECESTAASDGGRWKRDCSYLAAYVSTNGNSGERHDIYGLTLAVAADKSGFSMVIPTNPNYGSSVTDEVPWRSYGFGSVHPSIFHVLMGDGSVQGITKSVNMQIIRYLTVVDDGTVVTLP